MKYVMKKIFLLILVQTYLFHKQTFFESSFEILIMCSEHNFISSFLQHKSRWTVNHMLACEQTETWFTYSICFSLWFKHFTQNKTFLELSTSIVLHPAGQNNEKAEILK